MLLEIRIGPGKSKLKEMIYDVVKECRLGRSQYHRVPHFTLFGNFKAFGKVDNIKRIIEETARGYGPLEFLIDGYESKITKNGRVIAFRIKPSTDFETFSRKLKASMLGIVDETKDHDLRKDSWHHITVAFKLPESKYNKAWSFVNKTEPSFFDRMQALLFGKRIFIKTSPHLPIYGLRITFLNDKSRIICEYDLLQKRFLSREEALRREGWRRTLKYFRKYAGYVASVPAYGNESSTYLFSDMHLDHKNIIKYCGRPFVGVNEMNNLLVRNWNTTIQDRDKVYYLGDLAYGSGSRTTEYWMRQLKGRLIFISGNHENKMKGTERYHILDYKGEKFLLVHSPNNLPIKWNGWIIHGHKHNNDLKGYPFINGERKTINVSAEVLNYKPLNMERLLSLNYKKIKRMDLIDSKPEYFE
jgi:calcineurin-like phosphoesterase family protein